ncbi:MAG: hypothetical protein RMJ19_01950, partial [Gemmatales bacterium]|nr:hypothetical protein [Gemmatales bacterium]MDW8174409.1 hypothetical protein [Gemmatales bacterium]
TYMFTSARGSVISRGLITWAVVAVIVASETVWSQPGTGGKGDYYPLLIGTRWDFRIVVGGQVKGSISEVVADVETINNVPLIRIEAQVKGAVVATEHVRVSPQGLYRHRAQGSEAKPPILFLRYPAKAGDSWEFASQIGTEKISGKVKTRFEEVEVPAGKFKALATVIDFEVAGKPLETTIWFAEGVGKVKQTIGSGDSQVILELERFVLGRPRKP